MSKEAMKLALEKIADVLPAYIDGVASRDYLATIHKALAEQPAQQEPVATVAEVHMSRYTIEWTNGPLPEGAELYTSAQRTWVGLTDKEWQEIDASLNGKRDLARIFTRAIEAKLQEKNNGFA